MKSLEDVLDDLSINQSMKDLFVFDVESIGFMGEGFSVGYVVISAIGTILQEGLFHCDPSLASGSDSDRKWVKENCPKLENGLDSTKAVRKAFISAWNSWKDRCYMVADCPFPVEYNFIRACKEDDPDMELPYPFIDVASALLTNGKNPIETFPRKENELPIHNPLNDARQSARILTKELLFLFKGVL